MKRRLSTSATLAVLLLILSVVSCRDSTTNVQPKPKVGSARMMANSMGFGTWSSMLTSAQDGWIQLAANQTGESDLGVIEYDLYSIEASVGQDLRNRGLSDEMSPSNPFYCYIVALYSARVYESYGSSASSWIAQTVNNTGPTITDNSISYNYNIGKQYIDNNVSGSLFNYMFISGTRYMIPGQQYVGTYNGTPLYTASYLQYGSFTLPGSTRANGRIYLQNGFQNDQDLIRHEFGHILQGEDFGLTCFYTQVVPASIQSANKDGQNGYRHQCFETETDANRRSYNLLRLQYPNAVWNEQDYPFYCSNYDSTPPCP